jgi:hypothetical protein
VQLTPPPEDETDTVPVARRDDTSRAEPPGALPCDVRCGCGSLLARRLVDSIELKCRRCRRRILLVPKPDGGLEVRDGGNGREP